MRLCLLGASHAIKLRDAARRSQSFQREKSLETFAIRHDGVGRMVLKSGRLVFPDAVDGEALRAFCGVDEIDLDRFDAFVLYGLGYSSFHLAHHLRAYRDIATGRGPMGSEARLVSPSFHAMIAERHVERMAARRLINCIRRHREDALIVVTPSPHIGELCARRPFVSSPVYKASLLRTEGRAAFVSKALALFRLATTSLRKASVTIVEQDPSTVVDDVFTSKRFSPARHRPPFFPGWEDFDHGDDIFYDGALARLIRALDASSNEIGDVEALA